MTRKQVIDYLECYKIQQVRIKNLQKKREELRQLAFSLGSGTGGGSGGGHGSSKGDAKYTKAINSLADLDRQYYDEIKAIQDAEKRTNEMIEKCPTERCKSVLRLFYLDGMTAFDICLELDVTERYIFKIKRKAIDSILEELNKTE